MKTRTRTYFETDEWLTFNERNNFIVERHFNSNRINGKAGLPIKIWFSGSDGKTPEEITIRAIYYDPTKKIENYEPFESVEEFMVRIPNGGINMKKDEFYRTLETSIGSSILWKVEFSVKPYHTFRLYVCLSN